MTEARTLAARVRAGEIKPSVGVGAAIDAATRLDPELGAIVAPTFDTARARAADLDRSLDRPGSPPALVGVPLVMKDLGGPIEGDPAPNGNRVLRHLGVLHRATGAVGRRLLAAGAVSIGRSHSPELGSGNCPASSETALFGATRNPWDSSRTPMGSSGGSAAAVAAGIVPVAHATDGGGSIRMPASACGVVGLKPSRGRVSAEPEATAWGGGVIDGAITRSITDTAVLLDVLAGNEPGDDVVAPPPARPYLDEVDRNPGSLRCGVMTDVPYADTDPACRAAVELTADLLDDHGHQVVRAHPPDLDSLDYLYHYITVIRASGAAALAALESEIGRPWTADDVEDGTWVNYQRGLRVTAPAYIAALGALTAFTRRVTNWWSEFDVLVTPTLAVPPPPIGWLVEGDDRQRRDRLGATMPFTAQFNATGQPAVSLPLHWTDDGLPIGTQLVAAPFREDVLIRLGSQLEAAEPWAHRYPPLAIPA